MITVDVDEPRDSAGLSLESQEGFAEGTDGVRIHWSAVGGARHPESATLVCCDGIGCDGFIWKYLVRDFAPRHRIVRWHYRGHGRSGLPADRNRTGFNELCGDLSAVLRAADAGPAIFLGHSMGVQVALEYHRRNPDAVRALVLICGSHGLPLDTFHDGALLKVAVPLMSLGAERWPGAAATLWRLLINGELSYQLATRLEVNGQLVQREDFKPYFDHLSGMDPRLFFSMLLHAGSHSAFDHLPDVKVPTLVIAGTHDKFTPFRLSAEMHDRIPGSEMLVVPGGTHVAPIEQPELIGLRLERFLAAFDASRARQQLRNASR